MPQGVNPAYAEIPTYTQPPARSAMTSIASSVEVNTPVPQTFVDHAIPDVDRPLPTAVMRHAPEMLHPPSELNQFEPIEDTGTLLAFSPPRKGSSQASAPPQLDRNHSAPVPNQRKNSFDEIPIKGVAKNFNELLEEKMKDETTEDYQPSGKAPAKKEFLKRTSKNPPIQNAPPVITARISHDPVEEYNQQEYESPKESSDSKPKPIKPFLKRGTGALCNRT